MNTLTNSILERSISAKKRDMENARKVFTKSTSGYNGISHFGIMTAENPSSNPLSPNENKKLIDELKKTLKSGHYVWVNQDGYFGENKEHSLFIFNISIETLKYYSGKYDQTSFIYGELRDGKVHTEYCEKENNSIPYHQKTNPYVKKDESNEWTDSTNSNDNYSIIGKSFKYTIPFSIFEQFNKSINTNLNRIDENSREGSLYAAVFGSGETGWRYRGMVYRGMMKESEF